MVSVNYHQIKGFWTKNLGYVGGVVGKVVVGAVTLTLDVSVQKQNRNYDICSRKIY